MTAQPLTSAPAEASLLPGFADPVFDAQAVFRSVLQVTAYPARVVELAQLASAPEPFNLATAALCLTLMDLETSVWLDEAASVGTGSSWLHFHSGAPIVAEPARARFGVVAAAACLPRLSDFHSGEIEYPDRSTSVIIQVPSLTAGPETAWTGPGIKDRAAVAIGGLPAWFWSDWSLNRELYPCGIDIFFTCGSTLIGLPRTILVEA